MKFNEKQQLEHEKIMRKICLHFHEKKLPMILKGGTALRLCYNLDRFSEDLDFDSAKQLNLDSTLNELFTHLGKNNKQLRNPTISITKKTDTVRRYRVTYGDNINLKIETSFRGTPDDKDITLVDGILTYTIEQLIKQKLSALSGRTTARDLHDVIFLYENYYDHFDDERKKSVADLYDSQSEVMDRFNSAYNEDSILTTKDLLKDLMKLVELVELHRKE